MTAAVSSKSSSTLHGQEVSVTCCKDLSFLFVAKYLSDRTPSYLSLRVAGMSSYSYYCS